MRIVFCLFIMSLLMPPGSNAQQRMHKRLFPTTKHHQLKYEYIGRLRCNRMVVRDLAGKYGYVNSAMKEVVACVYDFAQAFGNGKAAVIIKGKTGLIDTNGQLLIPCVYTGMTQNHRTVKRGDVWTEGIERYVIVKRDSVTSIYDLVEAREITPEYEINEGEWYDNKKYRIVTKGGYYGIGLESGRLQIPLKYFAIEGAHDGLLCFHLSRQYGFFDTALNTVVDPIYSDAKDFSEGLAAVCKDGKWGFINTTGGMIIEPCYDKVVSFAGNIAIVKSNGKFGAINKVGEIKIPCIYDSITNGEKYSWWGGDAVADIRPVMLNNKWALIDSNNKLHTPLGYAQIYRNNRNSFIVRRDKLLGLINVQTGDTTELKYEEIESSPDIGCAGVMKNMKWGMLDTLFNQVVPDTFTDMRYAEIAVESMRRKPIVRTLKPGEEGVYNWLSDFYNGRASVQNRIGDWGYIDRKGKEVIPCRYSDGTHFKHGRAYVNMGDTSGYINKRGRFVVVNKGETYPLHKGIYMKRCDRKVGVIDRNGKEIIPCIYDNISWVPGGKLIVNVSEKYGCTDLKGNILLPLAHSAAIEYRDGRILVDTGEAPYFLNRRLKVKFRLDTSLRTPGDLYVSGFYNGRELVEEDSSDRFGYVNKRGKLVIPCVMRRSALRFYHFGMFHNGRALVHIPKNRQNDSSPQTDDEPAQPLGMINKRGRIVIAGDYKDMAPYSRRKPIMVQREGYDRAAFINKRGKLITPYMFPDNNFIWYSLSNSRWTVVNWGGRWMFVDKRGRVRLELKKAES